MATFERPRPVRSPFYLLMAVGALAVGVIGFSTTFFGPLMRTEFHAPWFVHVHGALFFAWLLLFIAQTELVRERRVHIHRRLGWAAGVVALGMVVSGVVVGLWATHRDVAAGDGEFARTQFVNILIEMLVFGALVAAGVIMRRKRDWHARLMLLATITVIGPAWFRFRHHFPSAPNPLVTFSLMADLVLVIPIVYDLRTIRRVHPAYYTAGAAMVLVHLAELFASDSALWRAAATVLLGD